MTLVSVTAYHSLGGEVEALNTPTIRRLTPSRRHQLPRITPQEFAATNGQEISCDLAAWTNHNSRGPFFTVQVSPRYVPKQKQAATQPDLDYFFNGGDRSHLSD